MDRGITETMVDIWSKFIHFPVIKIIGAVLYTTLSYMFDLKQSPGLLALIILIIFDFITAIANAYKNKIEIKSAKIFTTAVKFVVYFGLVATGHLLEHTLSDNLGFMDETILGFLALTETISILENAGKLGFAIPQKLLNKLEELRDEK
jgi:toxin secretion/phage lysis holin